MRKFSPNGNNWPPQHQHTTQSDRQIRIAKTKQTIYEYQGRMWKRFNRDAHRRHERETCEAAEAAELDRRVRTDAGAEAMDDDEDDPMDEDDKDEAQSTTEKTLQSRQTLASTFVVNLLKTIPDTSPLYFPKPCALLYLFNIDLEKTRTRFIFFRKFRHWQYHLDSDSGSADDAARSAQARSARAMLVQIDSDSGSGSDEPP